MPLRAFFPRFVLLMTCMATASTPAHAVTRIKANNTNNLNLATSWDTLPGVNDVASWTSVVTGPNSSALGADLSWRGILITNPGGPIAITGANTLTIANNGIEMGAATQNLTISSNLALLGGVGQIWNIGTGRTLTLDTGVFTRNAGATLSIQGAGSVVTTNIVNDATGIVGTWATVGTGASARYATVSGGTVLGLTGTPAATAADITDTTGTVNYDVAAVGVVGAGASFNTLRFTGGTAGAITGNFSANGILNAASATATLTLSGGVTIGANKELVVTTADTNRNVTISGPISNNATGTSGLTKAGNGTLALSGASTYTGITTVSRGTVAVSHASGLGSTLGGVMVHSGDNNTGSIAVGGVLTISGGITMGEAIAIANGSGNPQASLTNSGTNTLTGTLYATGAGIRMSVAGVLNFSGGIVANNSQIVFNGTVVNINTKPLDFGTGTFYSDSGGALITVGVAGSLWGDTMSSGGTVRTDVANALPHTTNLRIGVAYQPSGTVDLNGNNQTVASVRSDSFLTGGTRTITSAAPATLTINAASNQTLDARLTGALSLTKNGASTLSYVGAGTTTTGTITLNRGLFVQGFTYASASAAAGTVALSNNISAATPLALGGGSYQLLGRNNGTASGALTGASWNSGNNSITVASTAGLAPGQPISSGTAGIPAGAYVVAVISSTSFIINTNTTAAGSATTVNVAAASNFTTAQTFNSVTLNAGGSSVSVNAGTGDGTVLNLGTIARNPGGTVAFTLPAGTQNVSNGITLSNTNTNSILGGWATVGNDWAVNSTNGPVGNVAALAVYTDLTRLESGTKTLATAPAANVRIIEGTGTVPASITPAVAGTTDINTLLQSAPGAVTYDPAPGDVLRLGAEGGILMSSTAGAFTVGTAANDGVLTAGGTANTAGTLFLTNNQTTNALTINSRISNNGAGEVTLVKSGAGTLVLAGSNDFTGKTYIGAGRISIANETALGTVAAGGAADQLTLAGGTLLVTASTAIDDAGRGITLASAGGGFEVSSGTTLTVANVIAGTGELAKGGSGTLQLNNANTHTGETVLNAGILALGNVNALQGSNLVASINNAVTFVVAGTNTYNVGGLRGSGTIALGTNTLSVGANNLANQYTGVISGTGGVTKVGTGVLNFTGANTYTGTTLVSDGYLGIYNANALQGSTLDTGAASGTKAVIFNPANTTYNIGALQGADDLDIGVNNISVGAKNTSTTFSGAIVSAFNGNVTKVGTGTLALTGASTYGGSTTVSAGVLQVGQAGVGQTGYGAVSVASSAELIGTGTVQGASFTLASGATVRGGDTVAHSGHGTLTFTPVGAGTYALQSGSNAVLSINTATTVDPTYGSNAIGTVGYNAFVDATAGAGNHDRLVFNGVAGSQLTVAGNIVVMPDSFTAQPGQIFNLLDWSAIITPTFAAAFTAGGLRDGLADNGTQFDLPDLNSSVTGLYWDTSRFEFSGAIVVVPEPARAVLLLVGTMALTLRRRRMR